MTNDPNANEPDWDAIEALYDEARAKEADGDRSAAIAAYREVLALDPQDHLGVALRLAPLTGVRPDKAPDAYVAALFDQNAEMFDAILVDELGYGVPLLIADALTRQNLGPFQRWLDLGCGTGLCAMALEEVTNYRVGVDLAPTMVEIADELELYDELFVGEAVAFLKQHTANQPYDLITAADVLPYVGDVKPLLAALAVHSQPGAILALSTEWDPSDGATYALGPHKRFAHSTGYMQQRLADAGWTILVQDAITVRMEQDEPVPGELIIARKND